MAEIYSGNFNIESFINNISGDMAQGDIEDKKATKAQVHLKTRQIQSKREERVKNLIDQIKGVSDGGKGCMKVLKVVFKIIDFLAKPLSLLTMNQLKVDLSKTLDQLQDAKNQQKLMGLKINGQDILKSLQGLKTFLSDDMEQLKTRDDQHAKETQSVLRILEDIQETFKSINQL